MNYNKTKSLFLIGIMGLVSGAVAQTLTVTSATESTTDLFQSANITFVSNDRFTTGGESLSPNIFGGAVTSPEGGRFFFTDGTPAGTVVSVEFNTTSLLSLDKINLSLGDGGGNRGVSNFAFYSRATAGAFTAADRIFSQALASDYTTAYGTSDITASESFTPVTGQFFRIELTQTGSSSIRLAELDGFGSVVAVPEPKTYLMLSSVLLLFFFRKKLAYRLS